MSNQTFHIHIRGIVQGVGFRPFVYRWAVKEGLKGWVNNTNDGVHIEINAGEERARHFLKTLLENLPPLALVTGYDIYPVENKVFTEFRIVESKGKSRPNLLISPDVAMCGDCASELFDPTDRRHLYPFITCTNCGPRYSIITALPYDRPHTTMADFNMCPVCLEEYHNPLERRHFSQTNSCPDCPVEMQLYENGRWIAPFKDLDYIVKQWEAGKVIAIKGIGGFLLTCDATNREAVLTLRQRKKRPRKPFALMYPSIEKIEEDCLIKEDEMAELSGSVSPIMLLRTKTSPGSGIALNEINAGLSRLGVMLPYTPLFAILLKKFDKPVVATSGNISGSTIIYRNDEAVKHLSPLADIILANNRDIVVPQDDGVVQFCTQSRQKIVLRRSRGKAPVHIQPGLKLPGKDILATGAMLKSAFAFTANGNLYVSQYLGNTENFEAQESYRKTFIHLTRILQPAFKHIVTDKHPGYFSTEFGEEIAQKNKIPLSRVQHHKAHFISVLAENGLIESKEKILGVVWDGTGLGDDGHIWGGEFFEYHLGQIRRVTHIGMFDFILGDKMVLEPRISALALMHGIPAAAKYLQPKFSKTEWKNYLQLLENTSRKSTSTGRLFDAVSSLLTGIDKHSFEAEASLFLEHIATRYCMENPTEEFYREAVEADHFARRVCEQIIEDMDQNLSPGHIALKFHNTLAAYVFSVAERFGYEHVAVSGGVFQNALLVDLLHKKNKNHKLYFHKQLSPNDESIALGQLLSIYLKNDLQ